MGRISKILLRNCKNIRSIRYLILFILIFQFVQPVYGEEELNITVNSVTFIFMYTFSFDSPLYYVDRSYGDLMRVGHPNIIFRFNETYKNATFEDLKEMNNSGFIELLESSGDLQFRYISEPQYRISINPGYLWVYLKVEDTNLTQERLLEIYKNMDSFVYDNVSRDFECFKNPPNRPNTDHSYRFCPLNKQSYSLKYQREKWTFLINVEEFSPQINDDNYGFFKAFHPLYQYYPDDIKVEKRLRENYLFYHRHPRHRDTILVNCELHPV